MQEKRNIWMFFFLYTLFNLIATVAMAYHRMYERRSVVSCRLVTFYCSECTGFRQNTCVSFVWVLCMTKSLAAQGALLMR